MQRHLAAFKSAHPRITRNGLGALRAATRAHALPYALVLVLLTARRFQLTEIHLATPLVAASSVSSSKCGIFFTIPRKPGESGRSTIWLSFLRPSARTITLCFSGVQMVLRTSLIRIVPAIIALPYLVH